MEVGKIRGGKRVTENACGSGEVPCQGLHNGYVPLWETCRRQSEFYDTSLVRGE